jgi:2',3'-cyclic-nucleotide 2'-phosphodiesterase/3'-nucleotidase
MEKCYISNQLSIKSLRLLPVTDKNVSKFANLPETSVSMLKNIPVSGRILLFSLIFLICSGGCRQDPVTVRIAVTTDVHGMIYPYDLINRTPSDHSLAHIYSYAREQRNKEDTLFLLLDNGDFLQGQPTVYYYNFIDTNVEHLSSRVMNYMGYDAGSVGNHDIEAGPQVYDRVRETLRFPWLAANAVNSITGEPYFEPYAVLKAGRKKIAVLGLITPGIPGWLPKNLWPEMEFRDMVETAREWVPKIIKEENPDLLVGLFHSGTDASYGENHGPYLNENAVMLVAQQVPGFDIIFAGHDHRVSCQKIANSAGDSVLVIDPGSHGRYAGEATITFNPQKVRITGQNIPMDGYQPSPAFMAQFSTEFETVSAYLQDTITWLAGRMEGVDALFGPSPMMSLIHHLQLELTGAQVSFTAPLSVTAVLDTGPLLVSDMFKLYRFENMLYRMELSGAEIDGFLEHAAGPWFNTMNGPGDHLLQFTPGEPGRLATPYYNCSSASGIDYTVDVRRPPGDRVRINAFSDGTAFLDTAFYSVAVNSYRGNGGGGHLTSGAGIPDDELSARVSWSSDHDLRYYLMEYLRDLDTLRPTFDHNWRCIPEQLAGPASLIDRKVLD